jgi:hypothetical protein
MTNFKIKYKTWTIVVPDFGEHVTARMTRKMLYLLGQPTKEALPGSERLPRAYKTN